MRKATCLHAGPWVSSYDTTVARTPTGSSRTRVMFMSQELPRGSPSSRDGTQKGWQASRSRRGASEPPRRLSESRWALKSTAILFECLMPCLKLDESKITMEMRQVFGYTESCKQCGHIRAFNEH